MALVAVLLIGAAGCSDDQDPGIAPGTTSGGPSTTSQALAPCPPGGPDATTPPAGCLDEDGAVVRP
jgi:hypothetical protein